MAFCMYCGKQLEEGESCNCQSNGTATENETATKNQTTTGGIQLEKHLVEQNQQTEVQYNVQSNEQPDIQYQSPLNEQPNMQYQSPVSGQSNMQYQSPVSGQSNVQYQSPVSGQSNVQYQSPVNEQQNMQYQSPVSGQSNVQYQSPVSGQPNIQYQSQPNGQQMNQQQYQEKFNQAKEVSGIYLKQLWGALLGILKKPAEEGKRFVASGDKKLAIGFFVVQAILSGIFSMVICGKINGVEKAAGSFLGGIDSKYLFNLPKALLLTIIGSMIFSFAVAGLLYAGVKILKGTTTFWNMVCVAAVRSVGTSIFVLLSIIVAFLNLSWGMGIFALSALIGLVFMISAIQGAVALDENKQVYMVVGVVILALVVFYILFNLGIPMYVPSGLKDSYSDMIKGLGSINFFNGLY